MWISLLLKQKVSIYLFSFIYDLEIFCFIYKRIRQWPVTDIDGWSLVNESSRNKKSNSLQNLNRSPGIYNRCSGSDLRGYPLYFTSQRFIYEWSVKYATIYERSVINIRDWSLAYSFICRWQQPSWNGSHRSQPGLVAILKPQFPPFWGSFSTS